MMPWAGTKSFCPPEPPAWRYCGGGSAWDSSSTTMCRRSPPDSVIPSPDALLLCPAAVAEIRTALPGTVQRNAPRSFVKTSMYASGFLASETVILALEPLTKPCSCSTTRCDTLSDHR